MMLERRAWTPNGPAQPEELRDLRAWNPRLPPELLELLAESDGGDGDFAGSYPYIRFWSARWMLEANTAYEVLLERPDLLGFADDGGPGFFALDLRQPPPCPVVSGAFDSLDPLEPVADTLWDLLSRLQER